MLSYSPLCNRKENAWHQLIFLASALAIAFPAKAYDGYAQNVKDECAKASRPVPTFSDSNCDVCHQNTKNQLAYQSGDYVEIFCKVPEDSGNGGNNTSVNTAPTLEFQVNPQTAIAGKAFRLTLLAIDTEDDALKLSAKKLPPEAKLGKFKKINGQWIAQLTWKPKKMQTGKTYRTEFTATESRRKPKLNTTQAVLFVVGSADTSNPGLTILQSQYESGILNISGTVSQIVNNGLSSPPFIEIQSHTGETLGIATNIDKGSWSFNLPLSQDRAPCQLQVVINGKILTKLPVKNLLSTCR
jgi:hypothetical protein